MGSWFESISWGSCCGAAVCKSNGESGLFFCVVFLLPTQQPCPPRRRQRVDSVLFGSSFRCSDNNASPVLLDISRLGKTNVFDLVSLFLAKHLGVVGRSYDMIWFAGRVIRILGPLFWNALVLQFHGKLRCVGSGSMYPGFLWRMCVV